MNIPVHIFVILFFVQMSFVSLAEPYNKQSSKKLNITFVSPSNPDQNFWVDVHRFAHSSAKALGINLTINFSRTTEELTYYQSVEKVLNLPNKPDAIMAISLRRETHQILKLSKKYNVPIFLINNDLPNRTRDRIGLPRTKYPTYIGHIKADDYGLSKQLSTFLINKAKSTYPNKKINVIGISGLKNTPESNLRNSALRDVVTQDSMTNLHQLVHANWNKETALDKTNLLMKRYKDTQVIWYAGDSMALHSQKAWLHSDRKILSGGFDWTIEAIHSIKQGNLDASVGGHFTDAGFALVLLYDYFNGKDFADVHPLVNFSTGGIIHQGNIDDYYHLLTEKDWNVIDFKKYSRVHNPQLKKYDFSIQSLLKNTKY